MLDKGQTVNNRYEIMSLIARGGTSCVYLVRDRHIGRMLAMKAMSRDSVGSFFFARSEIEALRRVRYPLIPAIWDAFYDSQNIYIVSEFVKGDSLGKICKTKGLNRTRSLAIAYHICSALAYLHQMKKPMLYLDLKPDNIIVDSEGLPHLIDFGIAGCLAGHHIPVGTIGYSPPEQYEKDAKLDAGADIFAFGMTYYAIRCARVPDPDPEQALKNIRHSKILNSSEKSFLAKCCAISKEERYRETSEVLKQIRHIRSAPQKIRKAIELSVITAGIVVSAYCLAVRIHKTVKENKAAGDLYQETTEHMVDGNYSPEGIRIIKSAISSGILPAKCEQEFAFEVASNAMFVEHDYRTAAWYFSKLEPKNFPDAADYIELCRIQNGFDYNRQDAAKITGRLLGSTVKLKPSVQKYETLIFIASCYENFEPDKSVGLSKSIAVMETVKSELEESNDIRELLSEAEYERILERTDALLSVRKNRISVLNKEKGRLKNENNKK